MGWSFERVLYQPQVTVLGENIARSRFQQPSLQFIMPDVKIQDTYLAFPRPSVLVCKMAILSLHRVLTDSPRICWI